jgi:hypothetical protein
MLRSGLASTLEGQTEAPTQETMKEVCRPVGMKAMELSKENGWQVKQIATKYRNPAHAPDTPHSRMALAQFEQQPELMGFWENATIDGQVRKSLLPPHQCRGQLPGLPRPARSAAPVRQRWLSPRFGLRLQRGRLCAACTPSLFPT